MKDWSPTRPCDRCGCKIEPLHDCVFSLRAENRRLRDNGFLGWLLFIAAGLVLFIRENFVR